jgi:hypothetical protein
MPYPSGSAGAVQDSEAEESPDVTLTDVGDPGRHCVDPSHDCVQVPLAFTVCTEKLAPLCHPQTVDATKPSEERPNCGVKPP